MSRPVSQKYIAERIRRRKGSEDIVFEPDEVDLIRRHSLYLSDKQIAAALGMSEQQYAAALKANPEVARISQAEKADTLSLVAGSLLSAALDGDTRAAALLMRARGGWGDQTVDVNVNHEHKVTLSEALAAAREKRQARQMPSDGGQTVIDVEPIVEQDQGVSGSGSLSVQNIDPSDGAELEHDLLGRISQATGKRRGNEARRLAGEDGE
jgi:acyl-coenzyme A thioesterase PaaI-like protein